MGGVGGLCLTNVPDLIDVVSGVYVAAGEGLLGVFVVFGRDLAGDLSVVSV